LRQAPSPLAKATKPITVKGTARPMQNSSVHTHCSHQGPAGWRLSLLIQDCQDAASKLRVMGWVICMGRSVGRLPPCGDWQATVGRHAR